MGRMHSPTIALALATAAMMLASPLAPAGAATTESGSPGASPEVRVITTDVVAPVQIAAHEGKVYVGDIARSTLTRLGYPTPLAVGPHPGEIAGVDFKPDDFVLAYAATDRRTGQGTVTIRRRGSSPVVADVSRFEQEKNPDGSLFYGVHTSDPCVRDAVAKLPLPSPRPAGYYGVVKAHPYAVAAGTHNDWYVVDSAANDLLRIDQSGNIELVAVLPGQPYVITRHDAEALGLPDCLVGVRYTFEAVPTDVEVGADGALYVSTFPGGPESLQLGARGSVYRVDPVTGDTDQIITGLGGAVNLALGPNGRIYIAELFSGQISVATPNRSRSKVSKAKPLVRLPNVAAVEFDGDSLYASSLSPDYLKGEPTGNGSVVRIRI
ncbi:MAG TPA: ScyD/ScyE family protein [Kineosporiaceae bacterium]|nr:ScyD/ScyE family protein [Kineosporiaceae bacterium]